LLETLQAAAGATAELQNAAPFNAIFTMFSQECPMTTTLRGMAERA
jgi:hypothetical protein